MGKLLMGGILVGGLFAGGGGDGAVPAMNAANVLQQQTAKQRQQQFITAGDQADDEDESGVKPEDDE